jgi:hypothetical protein
MTDSTYRGWTIRYEKWARCFVATGPDYDADWLGEEDGWQSNGQYVEADSLPNIYNAIDDFEEEQDDRNYQRDCAGDAIHERRRQEKD